MNIKKLRQKIDSLDLAIVDLLNKRASLSVEIGKIKSSGKLAPYVPDREKEVFKKVTSVNKGPLKSDSIKAVYREIMSGSLSLGRPIKIAYFGPSYTFTHLASLKKFGESVEHKALKSITDVFMEVETQRCTYGVVPVENSIEGAVNHTLDMLFDSDLKICSEIYLEISHNVLSKEKSLKNIKKIYSIGQVFGQCRLWLEGNMPGIELIEVSSTARAAEIACKEKNSAAIASIMAAANYKLNILVKDIEDSPHNVTRFLVVGKEIAKRPTGDDKTSVMFAIKDKVGALFSSLLPFKKYGINLTKIESRPSKKKAWEYYFFADFNGFYEDEKVKKALEELEKHCTFVKILGSYPQAE